MAVNIFKHLSRLQSEIIKLKKNFTIKLFLVLIKVVTNLQNKIKMEKNNKFN